MVESNKANLERIATELVQKAKQDNKMIPNAKSIKDMIRRIDEEHKDFQCLICLSLVYKPLCCTNCETAVFCGLCL